MPSKAWATPSASSSGVLLARGPVAGTARPGEALGDPKCVELRRPLEEHVLHEVGDAGHLVPLVAGARADPNPQRHARRLRQGLAEDPESPRKLAPPDV